MAAAEATEGASSETPAEDAPEADSGEAAGDAMNKASAEGESASETADLTQAPADDATSNTDETPAAQEASAAGDSTDENKPNA